MVLIGPVAVLWGLTLAAAAVWFERWWVLVPAVLIVVWALLTDFEEGGK